MRSRLSPVQPKPTFLPGTRGRGLSITPHIIMPFQMAIKKVSFPPK